MTKTNNRLKDLERRYPEWAPWLAVIGAVLEMIEDRRWDAAVPLGTLPERSAVPLLAKAELQLDERAVGGLFENLIRSAGCIGTPEMASLQAVVCAKLDVLRVFRAALNQDSDRLKEYASAAGADPEAFRAVAMLTPIPFLQACNRRCGSSISGSWIEGYCPVCGAWPAFADVRGVERARYFRCGRCSAAWQARCLFCPYCGMTDHEQLETLVPQQSRSNLAVDVCNRCLGYVKALTTLQGSAAAMVIVDDAASVELDLAALERGYKRPPGAGYTLHVTVAENAASAFSA